MAIDVGYKCTIGNTVNLISRSTYISGENSANDTGTIDTVCLYNGAEAFVGLEFASFTDEGSDVFSTNGDTDGSALTAAVNQATTFTSAGDDFTAFAIATGEYIGWYSSRGKMSCDYSEYSGWENWQEYESDQIPCESHEFGQVGMTDKKYCIVASGVESGGTAHALAGAIAAASSLSGVLVAIRALSGAIAATSTVTGALGLIGQVVLAGAIAATSAATGTLKAARSMAGTIAATSSLTARLLCKRALSGAIAATSTVTGALGRTGQIVLAGVIAATSTATGSLKAARSMAGSVAAASSLTARLLCKRALSGAIAATSTVTGALGLIGQVVLAGAIAATSAASGSLKAIRSLAGAIASATSATGSLKAIRSLAGAIAALSSVTGRFAAEIIVAAFRRIFTKDSVRREFILSTERRIFNIK